MLRRSGGCGRRCEPHEDQGRCDDSGDAHVHVEKPPCLGSTATVPSHRKFRRKVGVNPYAFTMFLFTKPTQMVTPGDALPGRDARMPVPERHEVLGTPLAPPFPDGLEQAVVGDGLLLGRRARVLARTRRVHDGGRLRGRVHAEPHVRGGLLRARPATPRPCSSCSIRSRRATSEILRLFWENHDPTQGMRQGNDVGTQYRSAVYWTSDAQREAAEASRGDVPGGARARRLRRDHDRDRAGRAVLLRRGRTTSSTSRRTRTATAGSAAPAWPARWGCSRRRSAWSPALAALAIGPHGIGGVRFGVPKAAAVATLSARFGVPTKREVNPG